ncbi:MAG: bifunctional folylpolyglutamate synthase/dihydrofolate synthase [Deltaproteobacteria bacterium]|nr:bifunctional folylpolyglutamate synthase/dihydrofolate synthase [Deltaproteobacteria bacterium]
MPSRGNTLDYLFSLEGLGIKPGLRRIERLVALLNRPHASYPSIIVGGTNGKGSTASMIASILKESGLRVGLYTSPHLTRFNERIRVDGCEITDRELVRLVSVVRSLLTGNPASPTLAPSFFEFTTAMAFEHFRSKAVDMAVLEVGMGGRWDAVNAAVPLVSVITSVGLDHTRYLGETIKDIAFEKAGIIKAQGVCVAGVEDPRAISVIKETARRKKAVLYLSGRDFGFSPSDGGSFDYYGDGARIGRLFVGLKGPHQFKNAACALKAIEALKRMGCTIGNGAVRRGLKRVVWPGRFETVRKNPLVILDCAHNPEGAAALRDALGELSFRRLILVVGIMADKDISGIFSALLPLAHTVILTRPDYKRSATTRGLKEILIGFSGRVIIREKVKDGCKKAMEEASEKDCVCVTGSIFTVGEARGYFLRGL